MSRQVPHEGKLSPAGFLLEAATAPTESPPQLPPRAKPATLFWRVTEQ